MRAYTPTSSNDDLGYFDLVIKVRLACTSCRYAGVSCCPPFLIQVAVHDVGAQQVYWANEHPRFPAGGKLSQYLEALPIGGEMEVKGPLGHFHYLGRSRRVLSSLCYLDLSGQEHPMQMVTPVLVWRAHIVAQA